ncbi:MAG: oligosaccharide flippase family protein [Bilifractor sp.]|nr:oligosaccharide flippase family protein [Bilifractor sp.]
MAKAEGRGKYLAKNTLIFTLGDIGSKIISFFLIPLYTNYLSTEQYGTVDLITTIATVAVPVITLNIGEALMRFGLDKDADLEKNTQIGSFMLLVAAIIGIIIFPICGHISGVSSYAGYVYFYVLSLAASQIYLCDLRGKELLLKYSIGSILVTFLTAIFNIIFLVGMHMGIEGYLIAYGIANFVTALYALAAGRGYKAFGFSKLDKKLMRQMAKYSFVLIPNTFMWWIMNSSDRIMVTAMVGAAANGIYAISYKIPSIVSTATNIFNRAWSYSAIREENAVDEVEYNNLMLRMLTGWGMLVGIFILAIIKPFLHIYVAPSYYEAWRYTPFLVVGFVYMTVGSFVATSYTVHKDSFGFLFSGMTGAVINIVLNAVLIPFCKVYGAAFATCVSYIAVFMFRYFHTKKYMHYCINTPEFVIGSILLVVSSFCMFIDNYIGFAIQSGIFVVSMFWFSRDWLPILKKVISKVKH